MKDIQLFTLCVVTIMDTTAGLIFHPIAIVLLSLLLVSGKYNIEISSGDNEWASLTCK
jgi:hypothetical protein